MQGSKNAGKRTEQQQRAGGTEMGSGEGGGGDGAVDGEKTQKSDVDGRLIGPLTPGSRSKFHEAQIHKHYSTI